MIAYLVINLTKVNAYKITLYMILVISNIQFFELKTIEKIYKKS